MNHDLDRDLAMSLFGKIKLSVDAETKAFLDRCNCGWVNIFNDRENKKHFMITYPKGEYIHPEWLVIRVKEALLALGIVLVAVNINEVRYCYFLSSDRFRHTGKSENGKFSEYLGNK
ncbi:MAG: hypothetical protein QNJ38_10835 [Prochloraceae cyanobacterium]|nr:hypothetical protein [Prochloraceae cyanobacterium]